MDNYGDIHPLALAIALAAGFLMLILPRRAAIVPRILVLFGWVRVLIRSEYTEMRLNRIDRLMLLWTVSSVTVYTILWHTSGAFINRLGISFDIIGVYFLTRFLVRSIEDKIGR